MTARILSTTIYYPIINSDLELAELLDTAFLDFYREDEGSTSGFQPRTHAWTADSFIAESEVRRTLTCTCVGIHPGRIEPASPIALTFVSDGGTPGSTVLCELTRPVHPVLSPLCVAEDSRSGNRFQDGLDHGCHVFSWPPTRLGLLPGGVVRRRSLIISPSGCLAVWPNQRSLRCTSSAGMLVRQGRRRSSTNGTAPYA